MLNDLSTRNVGTDAVNIRDWARAATSRAVNLARLSVIGGLDRLYIFGDNDASGAGQKAVRELAARWTAMGREAFIALRYDVGKDWNSP